MIPRRDRDSDADLTCNIILHSILISLFLNIIFFLIFQEIDNLTKKNRELREKLEELETTKAELYDIIKFHFASCHAKSN